MPTWPRTVTAIAAAGLLAAWWVTAPQTMSSADLPPHTPDPDAGERFFWAGGCATCHASLINGQAARGADKLRLGGGLELETPYGRFRVPNISSHPDDGIGAWSMLEFVNAMQRGVSPDGRHYYPSFPYASYIRMDIRDVMDMKAFLDTLPVVAGRVPGHTLGFPWSVRRGIGAWKRRYLSAVPVADIDPDNELVKRGQALVEGAGHCGECHTPRDRFGGLILDRWLAGAETADGKGTVPDITPGGKNTATWSAADLEYYFESGFTPDFDTVGGSMVAVQENLAELSSEDRAAMAAYLRAIVATD